MKISEVFTTIQGEGLLLGVPSLFIRTSGCNLRCSWCDTPYTSWNAEGEDWPQQRLLDWVAGFPHYRHVVLTGGEPMMLPALVPLTRALHEAGKHITIETAGTVYQPVVCDLMSLSPKLANSTPHDRENGRYAEAHEQLRIRPEVLTRLTTEYDYQLKFVVNNPLDLDEIESICRSLNAPPDRVLLMPEGISADTLQQRATWLVEICKQRGYRFCPRLHVLLYGNQRGV